jgi:C-terminal processing protease CtpA/Prc
VDLDDVYRRDDDSTRAFWTLRDVAGRRFGGRKPLYVLTSARTVSGGEALACDRQSLHRELVVGERTAGGANSVDPYDLGDGFSIAVPWGRAVNPVTKTNWERAGGIPDIDVPAASAVEAARARA